MSNNDGIVVDTLFVGPTRPATLFGVTYIAFILNAVITIEAFVMTRNLAWLLLFFPVHGICYLICYRDPQTFDLFRLWGKTKGTQWMKRLIGKGNFGFWGASTYSPLALPGQERKTAKLTDRVLFFFRKRNPELEPVPINAQIASRKEHV